jgi:hypothetical protein
MTNRTVRALFSLTVVLAFAAAGCVAPTVFRGDAHIQGGAPACDAKCKGWGLEFVGMVAMGDYSDACICRRPGVSASALLDTNGSAAGSAAGVIMQMRIAEEQMQQATMTH